jgi:hypothetical protein
MASPEAACVMAQAIVAHRLPVQSPLSLPVMLTRRVVAARADRIGESRREKIGVR